jgi:hypothetical protein
VGTVEEVVEDDAETPGYMVVPRGRVFEREIFIPLEAVVKAGDGEVFVNVPRLLIGKMPWGERPATGKRWEKLGPRREEVANLYPSRSTALAFSRPELQSTEKQFESHEERPEILTLTIVGSEQRQVSEPILSGMAGWLQPRSGLTGLPRAGSARP